MPVCAHVQSALRVPHAQGPKRRAGAAWLEAVVELQLFGRMTYLCTYWRRREGGNEGGNSRVGRGAVGFYKGNGV
eukprot:505090-Pleurochrysis_carterae.AAC.2